MNITIMWMKEWVELYTFCKTCAPTLTVKRIFSGIQSPLQIFSSAAIVEDLPEPDKVFDDVKNVLEFLPEK